MILRHPYAQSWNAPADATDTEAAGFAAQLPYSRVAMALFGEILSPDLSEGIVYARGPIDRSAVFTGMTGAPTTFHCLDGTWHDAAMIEVAPQHAASIDWEWDRVVRGTVD